MDPDALLELRDIDPAPARCALWWRQPLQTGGHPGTAPIGRIGRLEAPSTNSARLLLKHACRTLRRQGCHSVLAPLDGDTWRPYRVLAPGQDPREAFAGEPDLAPAWADWLADAGFEVRARYISSLCRDLQRRRPMAACQGTWRIEPLSAHPIEALLEPIHRLIVRGFAGQPLFRAPGLEEFQELWRPWRGLLDRRFSLLAFDGPELVGLLLAHGAHPGEPTRGACTVVRTLVVRPGRARAGLGRQLLETCHRRAEEAGSRGVIHALMHEPGPSVALSRPYARPLRRYWLMGRSLIGPETGPSGGHPAGPMAACGGEPPGGSTLRTPVITVTPGTPMITVTPGT
ncbi:MAG: GNAT family N-acetyltransferase [Cyanobium sp.]